MSTLFLFNTWFVLSVGRIYLPSSLSVLISQIHDTQKEVQEKYVLVVKCQSNVLETWKFSELLWPVWIIEKPSVKTAQTYFIKKSCQRQPSFFFFNTVASVICQVLVTNYSCTQLSICLFSFFHPLVLKSAILILLSNMQNWQLCAKRVKKLWGDHLGIFFRLMLHIKLCCH